MVPRIAATAAPHPDAIEFVRYCYHRRRVGWPDLYDEMCAVAGRGLFRGLSADDLGGIGVGFSLFDMPALATLASRVVAEEVALRRPLSVVITGAEGASDVAFRPAEASDSSPTHATTSNEAPPATVPSLATIAATASAPPPLRIVATTSDERSFDVPIRLVLAPSGA